MWSFLGIIVAAYVQEKRHQYDMSTAKELANDAMMVCPLSLCCAFVIVSC